MPGGKGEEGDGHLIRERGHKQENWWKGQWQTGHCQVLFTSLVALFGVIGMENN